LRSRWSSAVKEPKRLVSLLITTLEEVIGRMGVTRPDGRTVLSPTSERRRRRVVHNAVPP
jgi:hypothetical protein